jgi:hypothetical protein
MFVRALAVMALAALPVAAAAEASPGPEVAALMEALRLPETFAVMRDEGVAAAGEMAEGMFPDGASARWADKVAMIYDTGAMQDRFAARFVAEMEAAPALAAEAAAFLAGDRGARILQLEIDGRRALLDDAVEEAAQVAAAEAQAAMDPRMALLEDLAAAGDLIEQNVTGALNANLAFYRGMAEGGALPDMDEGMMLNQVWSSEPQVRQDMEDWLYPYFFFAYGPLPDADLEAYVAFWESEAGQKVNRALFAGFDAAFTVISQDLGRASALMMQGSDI